VKRITDEYVDDEGSSESGKRWKDEDLPKSQWHLPDFLWFPAAELYGIQRVEYTDAHHARLTSPSNTAIGVWPLADPLPDWEVLT
jgi:hypothetical protein